MQTRSANYIKTCCICLDKMAVKVSFILTAGVN
jgi:hypothetical protein